MKNERGDSPRKIPKNGLRWLVLFSFLLVGVVTLGIMGCGSSSSSTGGACVWDASEWNNCNWQ